MSGQARKAVVRRAVDFTVADLVVTVGEIEGTVQLIVSRDGWAGDYRKVLFNEFANPATAAQLRSVADHLDSMDWEALS